MPRTTVTGSVSRFCRHWAALLKHVPSDAEAVRKFTIQRRKTALPGAADTGRTHVTTQLAPPVRRCAPETRPVSAQGRLVCALTSHSAVTWSVLTSHGVVTCCALTSHGAVTWRGLSLRRGNAAASLGRPPEGAVISPSGRIHGLPVRAAKRPLGARPRVCHLPDTAPPGRGNFWRSCGCADHIANQAPWWPGRVLSEALRQHGPRKCVPGRRQGPGGDARSPTSSASAPPTRPTLAAGTTERRLLERPHHALGAACSSAVRSALPFPAAALPRPFRRGRARSHPHVALLGGAISGRMSAANQLEFPRGSAVGSRCRVCARELQQSAVICHLCHHLPLGGTDPGSRGGEPLHDAV